jgi:hypothetical protein
MYLFHYLRLCTSHDAATGIPFPLSKDSRMFLKVFFPSDFTGRCRSHEKLEF